MRISLVAPYYNIPASYFEPFIQSIISQNWDDYELILVNDGSTDPECVKLLESVKAPHVKLVSKENGGTGSARNAGMRHITGDILYIVDTDDELMPGVLSFIAKAFSEDSDLDLLYISNSVRKDGEVTDKPNEDFSFTGEEAFSSLCTHGSWMRAWTWRQAYNIKRIGKDNIIPFNTDFSRSDDRLWSIQMMKHVKKGLSSSFIGYIYNIRPSSLSRSMRKDIQELKCSDLVLDYIEKSVGRDGYTETRTGKTQPYYEALAYKCLKNIRYLEARRCKSDPDKGYMKKALWNDYKELRRREKKELDCKNYRKRIRLLPIVMIL